MSDSYTRLYHKFSREFPAIYADDACLAAWVRLLLVSDASWPMRPPLPRSVKARPLRDLIGCGLVILDGDTYTVLGLDAERGRRSNAARVGAVQRWNSERNANALPNRDEPSKSRDEVDAPPPPAKRGRRNDGTNPRSDGSAPRDQGTNPRATGASVRQVRADQKRGTTNLADVLRRAAAAGRES